MHLDIDHLRSWIGRSEIRSDGIHPFPSNALSATLNRADPAHAIGTELPPLWHWLHFLPISPLEEAGPDGHPDRGGFLPPVRLPRRMWAGSRLVFRHPIHIGDTATRVSTIAKVEHKRGRSSDLVFVTVRHDISVGDILAIEEEHDIVYRDIPAPSAPAPQPAAPPEGAQWRFPIRPDAVLLFRYSALTFNSHRIHYDLNYAIKGEGYPGLVVHGPLMATLLLDGLRRAKPMAHVNRFSFRAVAPTFHIDEFSVRGKVVDSGKAVVWAQKGGALTMDGLAEFD